MRAILLAAGRGTRMMPLTRDVPKSLLPIGDSTIVGRLIEQLMAAGIDDVTVVVGYDRDKVAAEVERASGGQAHVVVNERYAEDVNILSLSLAMARDASPFLLVEADCIFTDGAIAAIVDAASGERSVWFACGDFTPDQRGGVIGAHADGRVYDVDIIPEFTERHRGYKKMVGVLKVGPHQVAAYVELLLAAGAKNTKQYYHMPWIQNLQRLECSVVDLGADAAVSVNTVAEYDAIKGRFAT